MKFYTLEYNANLPTKQQLNIPTNTDYKIGVKVVKNGELLDLDPADVTLGTLSADADKTNGYVTFTAAAGDDASYTQKSLVVDSESVVLKFDLVENIFKSQQGELDILGDTSNFYTKGETDAVLSAKADDADVFTREQLSAMFAPLKDTGTGAAKKASEILSGDVVASLFNVAVELYGEPVIPTLVKYTASSGLPDWEGDIAGELTDGSIPNKSDIAEVEIGSRVTSIGAFAFSGLEALTSVTISDSVTSIGEQAFSWCANLESVTIGNGVTSIGDAAFNNCPSLANVTIPDSVTSIGKSAFDGAGLTSVTIGNGVTSIGDAAFYNCSSLETVTIPNSVTSIGNEAFSGCSGFTGITIGDSVTSIGNYAFYNCSRLSDVTIPASVTYIGEEAFSGCGNLKTVEFNGNAPAVGFYAFSGAAYDCKALVSSTATGFPAEGETWNELVVEYK